MVAFLADENLNNKIVRGLVYRNPEIDIVTVRDIGMSGADDPSIMKWAFENSRLLITHDVKTIPAFAYENLEIGLPVPGILLVNYKALIGSVIDDLELIAECSDISEWVGQIHYLPL